MTTRDDAIVSLMPLVYQCAGKILRAWPDLEEYDELVGDGMIGAITAVDTFDEKYRTSLKTWAWIKVRGAMIDGIRRRKGRAWAMEVSLDRPISGSQTIQTLADVLPDDEDAVARMLDVLVVQEILPFLPEREAGWIRRYYWDGETLTDIAVSSGVTEGRVSTVLAQARSRMYRMLAGTVSGNS